MTVADLPEVAEDGAVGIHAEVALDDHECAASLATGEGVFDGCEIEVGNDGNSRTGEACAVDDRRVVESVADDEVAGLRERRHDSDVRRIAAGEDEGVLEAEPGSE